MAAGHRLQFAPYESLAVSIDQGHPRQGLRCQAGPLDQFDAVLARTMPAGSLEQITFRLAALHAAEAEGLPVINPPRTLETAIDKYATLALVRRLGYDVPPTIVVQSRSEAMDAFDALGGDVVVKPVFGGEGRGVMRICDPQLAWVTASTLERLDAVLYLQQFVPPGGLDTRLLVIGPKVWAIRRCGNGDWRTNVSQGGRSEVVDVTGEQREMALRIAAAMRLEIGSVDVIDAADGRPRVLEVNGVPGWKGAQAALGLNVAAEMIGYIASRVAVPRIATSNSVFGPL